MKKLLEDCLAIAITRLSTALAAIEPGASPQEVILAQADRMEDEGDERAIRVRAALEPPVSGSITADVAMIGHTNSPNINVYWQSPFAVSDRDRQS